MNERDLIEALQAKTPHVIASPSAADGVQRWVRRARRQRTGAQAIGVGAILAGLIGLTLLALPGSPHRSGPSTLGGTPTPSTHVSPLTPQPTVSSPDPAAACRSEQLALTIGPGLLQMTQERGMELLLSNNGKAACVLNGYPSLTIGDPKPIPYTYVHHGQFVTSRSAGLLTLAPGESAHIIVAQRACTLGQTSSANALSLKLDAADTHPIPLIGTPHGLARCTDANDNTIELSPYANTFSAAAG